MSVAVQGLQNQKEEVCETYFTQELKKSVGRNNVVGIAICYGLDGPRIEYRLE